MGGEAHLVVVAAEPASLRDLAVRRIDQLERRWSRFIETSDICRLARAGGKPVRVSADTLHALRRAIAGWEATAGRFDPTVGQALVELGYDRTFADIAAAGGVTASPCAPGCSEVLLDEASGYVTAPAGVQIDLGGIGKGLAADLVATELTAAGADGVCVNLGGDLRVTGTPPESDAWVVVIEHPRDRHIEVARVALSEGAIATSNAEGRAWLRGATVARHIIDPASGCSAGPTGSVTVVAGECWWAEVLATAGTVAGPAQLPSLVPALGGEYLHATSSGETHASPGFAAYAV